MSTKKLLRVFSICVIFVAGMLAGSIIGPVNFDDNIPTGFTLQEKTNEIFDTINPLALDVSPERASPGDWIKEDQINVYSDRVVLNIKNAQWAAFTNTNSMDPILDETANAIQIIPETEADINIGDIISYEHPEAGRIIHRVVYKGQDEKGTYFIMKGDNNPTSDPDRVYFDQVYTVTVAVIF
jgi:hypothetical protein